MQRISIRTIIVIVLFAVLLSKTNVLAVKDPSEPVIPPSNKNDNFILEENSESVNVTKKHDKEFGRIFRLDEFLRFSQSLQLVSDQMCRKDLNTTLWAIVNEHRWAVAMYDASAKGPSGVENGMIYQFGHYDECLSLIDNHRLIMDVNKDEEVPVRTKYCLADVTVDGITVGNIATRKIKPSTYTVVHWGVCVPATCNANDLATFLENYLQRSVVVHEEKCQVSKEPIITKRMLIYAIVILFFIFTATISTMYHIYLIYSRSKQMKPDPLRKNETLQMVMITFSIIENTRKLFQARKDQLGLNSINGIKAIAMIFILAGHALCFIYGGATYNANSMDENIKQVQYGFLTNSLLFVDTFLLLSGFLFCRILLIELERRRGKLNVAILYVARFVRLTPAYLAVIGFYMTWLPTIGDGPIWNSRIMREQERCVKSWWLNILYINNYIGTDNLCMFQSWYLSVDTQLFFLAPIVIFFLYKSRKFGFQFLSVLIVFTAAIPFVVTYVKSLDPTLLVYSDEVNDFATNEYYVSTYIKTHMRASGYVVGLMTGFVVHLMQEKKTKLSRAIVWALWTISAIVGIASMFAVTSFYIWPFTNLESSLYAGLHKFGWSFSVAWLVIAATTGHAGWLQGVLGWRVFAPISRLTYCAYLTNGIVELYHTSVVRSPVYMTKMHLMNDAIIHCLDTFFLALVLCLLFESPIHALERILLRSHGKTENTHNNGNVENECRTPSTSEEQIA